ncbi:MAG: T9SS type A sorting domain-containing protein [Bacteroidota bacterium]
MKALTTFLFLLATQFANAQISTQTLAFNDIRAQLRADGTFFLSTDTQSGFTNVDHPASSSINLAGFWMAGKDETGQIRTATVFDETQTDYEPLDSNFNKIWSVSRADIEQHLMDYDDNLVIDDPLHSIYSYPARGNPYSINPFINGFILPTNNGGFAPFYDANGDAIYNPDDGDYPDLSLCPYRDTYTDYQSHFFFKTKEQPTLLQTDPINMELQANLFGVSDSKSKILNKTLFLSTNLIYTGDVTLDSFYLGFYVDFALGCPEDDYIGVSREQNTVYVYNSDNEDEDCDDIVGFGANPPAVAITMLDQSRLLDENFNEIPSIRHVSIISGDQIISTDQNENWQPQNAQQVYNLLQGINRNGHPVIENGLMYDGNPLDPSGDTEYARNNEAGKRRVLISTGPIRLDPGAVNEVLIAFSFLEVNKANHLQNAAAAHECLADFEQYFDQFDQMSPFCSIDNPNIPDCKRVLSSTKEERPFDFQLHPNPVAHQLNIESDVAFDELVIYDAFGRLHWQQHQQATNTLDVSRWVDGVYFVKVVKDGEAEVRGFVVKR